MADDQAQQAAETAIREFSFDNYGLNDVDIALHDYPDDQEWVPALAAVVIKAVREASHG